jgi:hypothetical protein
MSNEKKNYECPSYMLGLVLGLRPSGSFVSLLNLKDKEWYLRVISEREEKENNDGRSRYGGSDAALVCDSVVL